MATNRLLISCEASLEELRPVVLRFMPSPDAMIIETDLTEDERAIIAARYDECMADSTSFTELKTV